MPATKPFCKKLVDELGTLPAAPDVLDCGADTHRRMLGEALMRWCADDEHARKVADVILATAKFRPRPSDIREAAEGISSSAKLPNCELCDNRRWVSVDDGGQGTARRCVCAGWTEVRDGKVLATGERE